MNYQKQLFALLIGITFTAQAQDTSKTTRKAPERRKELGVGIIVPAIIAIGATDYNECYTNLTYRYFISNKHALKSFFGCEHH